MSLENVLVTGAHTGLGRALTAACLEAGASVFALSRSRPEGLSDEPRLRFASLDLRRHEVVERRVAELLAGVARLDLAVLNAGVLGPVGDLASISLAELRAVMDVNLWANKVLLDALLDGTREVRQVVAISSGAARSASGGWGPYSISKAALNVLVRTLAREHPGTHFAALAPGVVDTAMTRAVAAAPEDPRHEGNARIRAAFAGSRVASPAEAARGVLSRLARVRALPSGSFADVREMEPDESPRSTS